MCEKTLTLTRAQAAALCGLSPAGFDVWVRKGIVDPSIPGTHRWSTAGLERRLSGLRGGVEIELDAFEAWEVEQNRRHKSHSVQRAASGKYVRSIDLPAWSVSSLAKPLGKREVSALQQIQQFSVGADGVKEEQIKGVGVTTITKLGARGLLVPDGIWYEMRLSVEGLRVYRQLASVIPIRFTAPPV